MYKLNEIAFMVALRSNIAHSRSHLLLLVARTRQEKRVKITVHSTKTCTNLDMSKSNSKSKYQISNWSKYDVSLKQRGSLIFGPSTAAISSLSWNKVLVTYS